MSFGFQSPPKLKSEKAEKVSFKVCLKSLSKEKGRSEVPKEDFRKFLLDKGCVDLVKLQLKISEIFPENLLRGSRRDDDENGCHQQNAYNGGK